VPRGSGIIQLGDVSTYGDWHVTGGNLDLSFDIRSVSLEDQCLLERYQVTPEPLKVKLPHDQTPSKAAIIGYERKDRNVVFFVSRREATTRHTSVR